MLMKGTKGEGGGELPMWILFQVLCCWWWCSLSSNTADATGL